MKYIRILACTAILCLTTSHAVFAAGKGANPNGKPFVEIQGQIVEVEGEISSLQDQIDSIVAKVDTMEARIGANEDAIAVLQAQNLDLQAQIDANATDISSLQATVDSLLTENESLQAQIDAQGDVDGSLQEQIDVNTGTISNLQLQINGLSTDLQAQIDNNNNLIQALQAEITGIQDSLALKQSIINGECLAGQAVRAVNADGSVVCEVINSGITSITQIRVWNYGRTPPGSFGSAGATCPSGSILTGGGGQVTQTSNPATIWLSRSAVIDGQTTDRTWVTSAKNHGNYWGDVFVFANCLEFN